MDKRLLIPAPEISRVVKDREKKFLFTVLSVNEPPPSETNEAKRWQSTSVVVLYMKKYVNVGGIMENEVHSDNVPERRTLDRK